MPHADRLGGLDTQALLVSFPFYVMLVDEDHTILMCNHAVRRQLGLLPEDIVGRQCTRTVHGQDSFEHCPLQEAVNSGDDAESEYTDSGTNLRIRTTIFHTGYSTPEGRSIFLHTAQVVG